jgi:hypothetical protein
MNDETRAMSSWATFEKQLQDNIDLITGIKILTFLKHVDKMETL